jgi:hypothetical protein
MESSKYQASVLKEIIIICTGMQGDSEGPIGGAVTDGPDHHYLARETIIIS